MRNIAITGASQRLGLYLAKSFLERGDKVFAITRNASPDLQGLKQPNLVLIEISEYSGEAGVLAANKVLAKGEKVDLLVNNASAFCKDAEPSNDLTSMNIFYQTHMAFPYTLTNMLGETLEKAKHSGVVINITDIYATMPNEKFMFYCSTKAGLANLTVSLAKRFSNTLRVNAIAPGPIKFLPEHTSKDKDIVLMQSLIKREGGVFANSKNNRLYR